VADLGPLVIRAVAIQGVALGTVALILGVDQRDPGLIAAASVVLVLKGAVIPALTVALGRWDSRDVNRARSSNVPASLVAAAALIVVAFVTPRVGRFVGTSAGPRAGRRGDDAHRLLSSW